MKQQPQHGRKRQALAFSLVEVLVAIVVVLIMALSFYGGISTGFMLVDSAREDLRATQILLRKTEAIRLCTYSSLSNCPISFVETYDPTGTNGTIFRGTITTNVPTLIPDTAGYKSNMCLVTINLFWTNNYGRQLVVRNRQMQTLVARYGLQNYIWGAGP